MTFDQQIELTERLNKVLDCKYEIIIPYPYSEIVNSLVSKLEDVGGLTNGNEPTEPIATSPATDAATTTADAATATAKSNATTPATGE